MRIPLHVMRILQLRRDVRSVEREEAARQLEAAALSEARAARARKSGSDAAAARGGGEERGREGEAVFSRLYKRAEKKRAASLAAAAAAERLLKEEELAKCTFTPKISRRAEHMVGAERDVFDRLNKSPLKAG